MNNLRRNIVIVTVLLFVCAAVYLNWSYNNKLGTPDTEMVAAEDAAMREAERQYAATLDEELESLSAGAGTDAGAEKVSDTVSEYFAQARLTRQQSRDEALSLLETAASAETASQETIDSAILEISTMAEWSMKESQIENLLIAKDFTDCVVFISNDGITVAVPAPAEGLSEATVARITETITSETDYTASQLNVIEIKDE